MRIRYWSLDVCSSDLAIIRAHRQFQALSGWQRVEQLLRQPARFRSEQENVAVAKRAVIVALCTARRERQPSRLWPRGTQGIERCMHADIRHRSEEHTSELQSLMHISYAVFCLKKKITKQSTD